MYLHRLALRAIGPYPELVTIDFAALAASGVFLLEGPTGSGKSTIIDAVVFALYGGLAGEGSTHDRLHSQHADPGVEPFVELVFETGAGAFRVRRTPQYDRPKQRGAGTVRQQASAQLFRLAHPGDAVGEPVSSRIPEIGLEVVRVVGLDRAQFLQTVVLPQGEFARFLRSPGEDRRKLLQSLFGTQVYDRTADELAARRRAVQAEVDAADARVRDALSRFAQAAGLDDDTEPDERSVPATAEVLRATATEATARRADAVASAERARAREQDVAARIAARDRRSALLDRRRGLDERAPRVAAARERLDVAERAARVTASADGLDAARARAAETLRAAADVRRRSGIPDAADPDARRADLAARIGAVRHLVGVEDTLADRRRALAEDAARTERLAARVTELDAALDARPAARAALVEEARSAAAAATDAEAARAETERVRQLRADLDARDAAAVAVVAAEQVVADRRRRAEDLLAAEQTLRSRRIAGLAGELGAALVPGDPCPVCGAVEHPDVALPQSDHPDADAVDAAAADTRSAEGALADAATDLAVGRAALERLRATVGDADVATLADRAAAAEDRVRAAHDAAVRVAALEGRRTAHDDETRALEREHNAVQAERAVLVATSTADAERLGQDADAVSAALAQTRMLLADPWSAAEQRTTTGADADPDAGAGPVGVASLRAAVGAAEALVALADAVTAADERTAAAARAVVEREAEVARTLADQDFDALEAARAAVLSPEQAATLRAEVAAGERERAVVDAGLAEPAVVAAADDTDEELDLDAARAAHRAAVEHADEATRAAVTATDRATAADRCATDVARAVRSRDDVSVRSRAVVRLADVANGAAGVNPTGITLGTYVLMRRFEDVVAAANDRLRGMLAGRFTLETSDEREAGSRARRTGLALAVHDHSTDTRRAPGSLSGGETFTVSLCLALGLADVVQAEAGGVSLGTLFVDEGFGTLDPETLDDVIGQLARLTAGGRQVGIVSHVEELKQRIPERIAVRRAPDGGSRVTTTV